MADLGREEILAILHRAELLRTNGIPGDRLTGKILGLFFFQPSTRTRIGFHVAMARLGGSAVEITETKYQPGMGKAESLSDTVRSISSYCDVILLRHPSLQDFHAAIAASDVPIINGGSGYQDHPAQALVDLFGILRHFAQL
jgi:aspartate carbamoyltransferase catalytic subunit